MAINVNTKYANYIHNCNAHKSERNKQKYISVFKI